MQIKDYDYYNWAKYQWEFKRRSPAYKKVYELYIKKHGVPSYNSFTDYPDPSLSFEELIDKNVESLSNYGNLASLIGYLLISPKSVSYNFFDDEGTLKIEIDFKVINSIKTLKEYVGKIIDDSYHLMKESKQLPKKKKKSMIDFDVILQVGDLKREGKKNREIAEIIDSRKYKEKPESAIRLIAYYHKKYLELINGGYIDITYP